VTGSSGFDSVYNSERSLATQPPLLLLLRFLIASIRC
jgi:hypothetical protein